jgi:hypothetical protein
MRLLAVSGGTPVVIEVIGHDGGVTHRLGLPEGRAEHVADQLRALLPGLATKPLDNRPSLKLNRAVEVRLSTAYRPLRHDAAPRSARAIVTALGTLASDETMALQWVLGRERHAQPVPSRLEGLAGEAQGPHPPAAWHEQAR